MNKFYKKKTLYRHAPYNCQYTEINGMQTEVTTISATWPAAFDVCRSRLPANTDNRVAQQKNDNNASVCNPKIVAITKTKKAITIT
jgi:hypothetical protein